MRSLRIRLYAYEDMSLLTLREINPRKSPESISLILRTSSLEIWGYVCTHYVGDYGLIIWSYRPIDKGGGEAPDCSRAVIIP